MPSPETSSVLSGTSLLRTVLDRAALVRLGLAWASVALLTALPPLPSATIHPLLLLAALAATVAVIVVAAGGVVQQAEALARRLGDPYGTLVLTLSIVVIEVVLIAAVMLGPGEHTTIARDSVMAVSMIILNLVFGICLVVGGIRYGGLRANRAGTMTYIGLLAVLGASAFALPGIIGTNGILGTSQAVVIAVLTIAVYGVFLVLQTGRLASTFQEVEPGPGRRPRGSAHSGASSETPALSETTSSTPSTGASAEPADRIDTSVAPAVRIDTSVAPADRIGHIVREHRAELLARAALLIATALPIVLLSHHMAGMLDDGLSRLGAPTALGGVLIAMIVFTPESITAVRAALGGEIQRVVNLCHGALVSTFALTIPTVLVISLLTQQPVVLAESPTHLALLGATLALCALSVLSSRMRTLHGIAHLALFAIFAVALFV